MIDSHSLRHPTTTVVMKSLLWLWLIGLSVIVALGYLAMTLALGLLLVWLGARVATAVR